MEWQNTPEGRLFYSLRGAIAEYEKEKFKVRSRLGRLAKARRGLLPFDPRTYGYRYTGGRYEVDEARAAVYRRMVEMALAGKSAGQIAAQLNAEGVPGPEGGRWHRQTVRRILKSPVYTGVLHVNHYDTEGHKAARQQGRSASLRLRPEEEWIAVPVPALIGREEWERLQQALAARRRGNQGGRIYEYHLSGLVYCGCCGARMAGGYGKSSSGRVYRYYICTRAWPSVHAGRAHLEPCPGNRHRADGVEEAVWARVREWLADPEELAKAARDGEQPELAQREASRMRRLAQISRERERAFEAFRRGLVDAEMFERAVREAQAEQAALEARLRQLEEAEQAAARAEQGMETLRELARQVAGRIDDLDWKDREKLIRLLVQRVTVHGDNLVIETAMRPPDAHCDIGTQTVLEAARKLELGPGEQELYELLARISGQDVERGEDGRWRLKQGVAKDRIISTTDPEMRHGRKSAAKVMNGYKAHLAMDEETELVVGVEVTAAYVYDAEAAPEVLAQEPEKLKPKKIIGDAAYGTAKLRQGLREQDIEVMAPVPGPDLGPFGKQNFKIDLEKQTCVCPGAKQARPIKNKRGELKAFAFSPTACGTCPFKDQCAKSRRGYRVISINPQEKELEKARAEEKTPEFKAFYNATRPKVERKLAEAVRHGLRDNRYIGRLKTRLHVLLVFAAVNLKRLARLEFRASLPLAETA